MASAEVYGRALALTVLTWNLFHGRADPPAGRPLLAEFAAALAAWEWDVALLQEVPPWWPAPLAWACGAQWRAVLTSRNSLPAARRALASRAPDLLRASGGGADAILSRRPVAAHARRRLRVWPERRWVHAVALEGRGAPWVANVHASTRPRARVQRDVARAAAALEDWAGGRPAVLGGDLNLRDPSPAGFAALASDHVDHVLARGCRAEGAPVTLERGALSDHAPLRVTLSPAG